MQPVPKANSPLNALAVTGSQGRKFHESPHRYRTDFQRDRDRVVHSRAFRRLENKTQVFTRRFSDHFRNRLTHTIEVAQISRTIAHALGLNGQLVEALALVHDVGHPPFGHAGEKALDAAMRAHGYFFDHNLHALRIVEDFESRYADFRGLNLTFEVREGIVKHSRDYSEAEHPELSEYRLNQRPPLEAQLIDLTDEIAYNTADLDDAAEANILSIEKIRTEVEIFGRCWREAERAHPQANEKLLFNDALRRMMDLLVTDLIENTAVRAADVRSLDDVRCHPERIAALSPPVEAARRQCKEFLYANVYYSRELQPEKDAAERIIAELFEYWRRDPQSLPEGHREKLRSEPPVRVICDYIAGMTDNYILERHKEAGFEQHLLAGV